MDIFIKAIFIQFYIAHIKKPRVRDKRPYNLVWI